MRTKALWKALPALVSACYLSPDRMSVPTAVDEAGATAMEMEMDGGQPSDDASVVGMDATPDLDTGPVDAGCSVTQPCPASAPVCSAGVCVPCSKHSDCSASPPTPACGPAGSCVPCAADQEATCTGPTPACDPATNSCVECVERADCSEQKPACLPTHTCSTCSTDDDCSRFGKVCNVDSHLCVQCRPQTEEADCRTDKACDPKTADCAGTACNPKTLTCGTKPRGSVTNCHPCVADTECATSHRCIPLEFGEGAEKKALGGYCLLQASEMLGGCRAPYTILLERMSLSGAPATEAYCGIVEATTTCEAIEVFESGEVCTGEDASCGALGSRCETVQLVSNTCTYTCSTSRECPGRIPCGGPPDDRFCGGPTN